MEAISTVSWSLINNCGLIFLQLLKLHDSVNLGMHCDHVCNLVKKKIE